MRFHTLTHLSYFIASACSASWSGCPPAGPLLPRPTNLHNSSILQHAISTFEETLHSVLNGSTDAGFSVANTSFSLGLVALDSPGPLWSFHHRGSANTNGTEIIDNDTQYLIGSISKLITDLLVLRTGIDLDTPITDYLPSLANETSKIKWEEVTLAALADHLSGIPSNYGFSDFYWLQPYLEELGFPEIGEEDYAPCGVTGLNDACSEEGIKTTHFDYLPLLPKIHADLKYRPTQRPPNPPPSNNSQHPPILLHPHLHPPQPRPERHIQLHLLQTHIIAPFNLTNTGASPGTSSLAATPPVPNSWGSDYGLSTPGGGHYTSLSDLSRLLHSVLVREALGTKAEVENWLEPHSSTSSPYTTVGRPWEIYHLRNLTSREVDVYGKNGGAYGYVAQFSLVDSLGMGIVVLTAGDDGAWGKVYDAMLGTFVPAVWDEAREQAVSNGYSGRFVSRDGLVSMGLKVAKDGVGVELESLTRNGSDMLDGIVKMSTLALPQFGELRREFRIFPTDVEEKVNGTVVKQDWRINMDYESNTKENSGSDMPGQGVREDECKAWQTADWLYYGGQAVDRIAVVRDEATGHVIRIEVPYLRAVLHRETS